MRDWQVYNMRTCAQPVVIRANCPKMKYHPLCGRIIIFFNASPWSFV